MVGGALSWAVQFNTATPGDNLPRMSIGHRADVPKTSVIVVAISSAAHIRRCLEAIESQRDPGECEIIVAADPRIGSLDDLVVEFPDVVFLPNTSANTPVALTAIALRRARGERIVLTEDSCIANRDWLAHLLSSDSGGHAAVGGSIEVAGDISNSMWAFAYVDFFRYMRPLRPGHSPSLSVCNVAYSAEHLRAVEDQWRDGFHETNVHEALARRFGTLSLNPDAIVQVSRNVELSGAIYERYAFGRLFGATRISRSGAGRRLTFALLSVGLPFLLMGRLTAKSFTDTALLTRFARAFPILVVLVLAWSWGEWLGYVTKSLPRRTTTAPEITASGEPLRAPA